MDSTILDKGNTEVYLNRRNSQTPDWSTPVAKDKDRVVALQKQLRIARDALLKIQHYGRSPHSIASEALDKMNAIEWNSKPTPLLAAHEEARR